MFSEKGFSLRSAVDTNNIKIRPILETKFTKQEDTLKGKV